MQRDRLSLQEQYRGDPLCTAASISQVNVVNDIWILGNRMVFTQSSAVMISCRKIFSYFPEVAASGPEGKCREARLHYLRICY